MVLKIFFNKHLHSNLVIFEFYFEHLSLYLKIDLHSNLVIFEFNCFIKIRMCLQHLHSNLVIFESVGYGDIFPTSSIFTFQSGDIRISCCILSVKDNKQIYIPIWWYSNADKSHKHMMSDIDLHSNLVIFELFQLYRLLMY